MDVKKGKTEGVEDYDIINSDEVDDDEKSDKTRKETALFKCQHDESFRRKFLLSVFVCWALMTQGCAKGQMGPAILDLLYISGSSLEQGIAFMTSYSVGRMVSSLATGALYNKVNKLLIFAVGASVCGITAAIIPWCFQFELMVFAFLLYGIANGLLDVAITSESLMIWGPNGRYFVHISRFCYSVVTVVAPLMTAPFLLSQHHSACTGYNVNVTASGNESLHTNISLHFPYDASKRNVSCESFREFSVNSGQNHRNSSTTVEGKSNIYIAYTISSALAFSAAIPFFVLFCKANKTLVDKQPKPQKKKLKFYHPVTRLKKYGMLTNIGFYAAIETATDSVFPNFLTVFCVDFLAWEKGMGAYLTSIYFLSKLCGRFAGIFILKICKSNMKILGLCVSSCIISFAGFSLFSYLKIDNGVWIFTIMIGLSMAIGFSTFLCWTNEIVLPVTGQISAYVMITSFTGASVSPIVVGLLMEKVSYMWFCLTITALSCCMLICYIMMALYTYSVKNVRSFDNKNTMFVEESSNLFKESQSEEKH